MRSHSLPFAIAVAAGLALATPAGSQVVIGTVRDSVGQPVPLAHVFGADSLYGDPVSVGTVTDVAGRYVLRLGARSRYVAARRIGYVRERASALDWAGGDTLRVDLVLRAMPYQLPTAYVGTNACVPLDSVAKENEVRQLWEGAVATIAAREAFLNAYRYSVAATHRDRIVNDSMRTLDTTYVVEPPLPPVAKDLLSRPLATYTPASRLRRRAARLRLSSPGDRALLLPQFFQRFCFEDRVAVGGNDLIEVHFRERQRRARDVEVTGVMTFRRGIPGPSRVSWHYVLGGQTVGRSESHLELVDVNGTVFPLMSMQFLDVIDPETGRAIGGGSVQFRYVSFTPIGGR